MSLSPGRVRHRDPNRRGGSPLWAYLALMSAPGNLPRALRCFKLRVRPASRAARREAGHGPPNGVCEFHWPLTRGARPRVDPGSRHLCQVLEGRQESPVDTQRTIGARVFRYVEEDLFELLLGGVAEPIACRHSGLRLDTFPQPLHGRWPVRHAVIRDFAQGGIGKLAEVRSGTIQKRRGDPFPLFFA